MDASAQFKGKKITVMGLGLLGRGVGDVKYLASCGAELIVTDLKSADELKPSLEELKDFPAIIYVLGEHRFEDFRGRDMVIKAAGVPLDSPYIVEARKSNTPVKMSASLFAEIAQVPVIGVTGTRGKSTTTHMLNAILTHTGKNVLLGGNVQGVSTLALLSQVTPEHIALFELDSWQLQGFGDSQLSPQLAVFTTLYPDHLNYYGGDLDAYLADKANIFLYQKPEDTLVLGAQCVQLIKAQYGERMHAQLVIGDTNDLPKDWQLMIPGEHNRYDAALALLAARAFGISDDVSKEALESFKGVAGRLELIRTIDGVAIYNDTTATTPEATLAALAALGEAYGGRIVLIMGGADKGLDMNELVKEIPHYVKHITFLNGTGTERVRQVFPDTQVFDTLEQGYADARANVGPGDAILFSPAFASFGMFKNEYDRGEEFVKIITSHEA
ncbi:MAG: UDP-N-acetylmuramoyl-L-alanine--D-glutamate ligase [Candidatus Pacebacteria bacterium]|nr:UDP-N-acetylmuramoyl-L-alanine--D-glutamate ligase [Candidatus Paceibacterota bacterium]